MKHNIHVELTQRECLDVLRLVIERLDSLGSANIAMKYVVIADKLKRAIVAPNPPLAAEGQTPTLPDR